MKKYLHISLIWLLAFAAHGQRPQALTLEQCIDAAISSNYDIQNQLSTVKASEATYRQSELEKLPSVSGDFSQGFNLGRNIDPFSNQYVTKPINSATLGVSSTVTIYNGDLIKNTVILNKNEQKLAELEVENLKFNIKKDVTLAFLEVLVKQEVLRLKQEQKSIIEYQLQRNQEMSRYGNEATGIGIDLKAQLESEQYGIIQTESDITFAKLRLMQLMNLKPGTQISLKEPIVSTNASAVNEGVENLSGLSFLRQKQQEVAQSDLRIRMSEGTKKPSVFLNSGLYTNYSSQAAPRIKLLDGEPQQFLQQSDTEFIQLNNQVYPLTRVITQPNFEEIKRGYVRQLFSNAGLSLSLGLSYPIYDKNQRNTQIQLAKINKLIAQTSYNQTQTRLSNELAEIKTWISTSMAQYNQAVKQTAAQQKAFELATLRFEEGMINFASFNQAKLSLEAAKSNVIQNKYTHYFYNLLYGYYR